MCTAVFGLAQKEKMTLPLSQRCGRIHVGRKNAAALGNHWAAGLLIGTARAAR